MSLKLYFFPTNYYFEPLRNKSCIPENLILYTVLFSIFYGIPFTLIVISNVLLRYIALKNIMKFYTIGKSTVTDVKSKLCYFKNCLSDTQNQKQKKN